MRYPLTILKNAGSEKEMKKQATLDFLEIGLFLGGVFAVTVYEATHSMSATGIGFALGFPASYYIVRANYRRTVEAANSWEQLRLTEGDTSGA